VSARRKIALIIGQLHRGGGENQLAKLAVGLHRGERFEPTVCCLSDLTEPHGPALVEQGVRLHVLGDGAGGRLGKAFRLRSILRDEDIDIAHAFLLGPSIHAAVATVGRKSPPLITSIRTAAWKRPPVRRLMEGWALKRAAAVTVNSTPAAGFVSGYYGLPAERILFIPNGVEMLRGRMPDRDEARKALDLPPAAPVMLGLFRLSPEKDLDLFCGVVEDALSGTPDGTCLIAGDGPMRQWLEKRVAGSPRTDVFRILGARDDVPALFAASDLLLLTSRTEGMPNSVLEAMSAGLPVVATNVGGLPDLVEDGVTGYLRESGDGNGLAAACAGIIKDRTLAARMGERAAGRAEAEFSVGMMVGRYEAMYEELLAGRGRTGN
jgi:glycosyltransferase involved in cell wall biosynthesis